MLTAIRQWVLRTMMKSKGQTGVVQTIPKKELIELNTQITAQRLMQSGIEPNSLKNADQVENAIIAIESRPKVQEGIKSTSSAKVFDLKGKEIPPGAKIMGGKELKDSNDVNKIIADIKSMDPIDSMKEANAVIGRKGKYKDLTPEESKKILQDTEDHIFERDIKPKETDMDFDDNDFAQGGRAGFSKGGSGILKLLQNMIKPKGKVKFDERRFREGPIDLDFLGEIKPKDLEKFIRTRDTGGRGGYGMYENFADMPAGLRAAELISTIKGPANKINYKAAELFLGKKLRGDETVDELLQVLNRQEMRAEGGRIGYKDGPDMGRRTFLKILGGLAAVPIIGKFIKPMKVGKTIQKVPLIKTDNVPGKPEWFDSLVNKVIIEGDDVTKKFATKEREIIHSKDLGDGTTVRVTQDIDDGAVRVEYESDANVFEDTVQMEYKKPLPDEGDPNPAAEFMTAESGPVGRRYSPDDYEIEIDEVGGTSIKDLDSDVSKLKEYATGQKPTIKEIVQNKRRKDKARAITEDPEARMDVIIRKQGEMVDNDYDYASGGIARMLGE